MYFGLQMSYSHISGFLDYWRTHLVCGWATIQFQLDVYILCRQELAPLKYWFTPTTINVPQGSETAMAFGVVGLETED